MEYNGIGFEEGPWPQKAYWDAMGRARERDAGTYIDYGWTRPKVISRGEIPQVTPGMDAFSLEGLPQGGAGSAEEVPTPEPTPAQPPRTGEGTLPEPMPLETRLHPLPTGKPKLSAAEPKSESTIRDEQSLRRRSGHPDRRCQRCRQCPHCSRRHGQAAEAGRPRHVPIGRLGRGQPAAVRAASLSVGRVFAAPTSAAWRTCANLADALSKLLV